MSTVFNTTGVTENHSKSNFSQVVRRENNWDFIRKQIWHKDLEEFGCEKREVPGMVMESMEELWIYLVRMWYKMVECSSSTNMGFSQGKYLKLVDMNIFSEPSRMSYPTQNPREEKK